MSISALLFVYNADGGPMALAMDFAHKILSPRTYPCSLCRLTYGAFTMRSEWRDWLRELRYPARFYHRDEFAAAYPQISVELPALFAVNGDGVPFELLSAAEISPQPDIAALIAAIEAKLALL